MLPLFDNEGNAFEPEKFFEVQRRLLARFGGYRCQPLSPHFGSWMNGEATYYDRLLMFTVDAPRSDESLDWYLEYKQELECKFQQVEIYLAISEVLWF
jgi:hypothetical protein